MGFVFAAAYLVIGVIVGFPLNRRWISADLAWAEQADVEESTKRANVKFVIDHKGDSYRACVFLWPLVSLAFIFAKPGSAVSGYLKRSLMPKDARSVEIVKKYTEVGSR